MARVDIVRIVITEIESHGLTVVEVRRTGKHPKVYFQVGDRRLFYTCSLTASDQRTVKNARAGVRRLIRQYSKN